MYLGALVLLCVKFPYELNLYTVTKLHHFVYDLKLKLNIPEISEVSFV